MPLQPGVEAAFVVIQSNFPFVVFETTFDAPAREGDEQQGLHTGIGGRVLEKDVRGAQCSSAGCDMGAPSIPPVATGRGPVNRGANFDPARTPTQPLQQPIHRAPPPKPAPSSIPDGHDAVRIPFRGVRRTIANRFKKKRHATVPLASPEEPEMIDLTIPTLRREPTPHDHYECGERIAQLESTAPREDRGVRRTRSSRPSRPGRQVWSGVAAISRTSG